jgi:ABC-type multidrug transport system ATPase subunit
MLSIAMSLVGGSRLIILDEPTSGLDDIYQKKVWDLLDKIKQGRTIIICT